MTATQMLFPTTRTERQIQRLGIGPWALTPEATALFARRQRMRALIMYAVAVPVFVAYLVAVWQRLSFADHPTGVVERRYALWTGMTTAFYGFVMLLGSEVRRRLERRTAADLPARVTRVERTTLLMILGRVRFAYLIIVLLAQAVMAVALLATSSSAVAQYRWGFLVALLACVAATILGLTQEVRRPAIAVDAVSLAIDERTRSQDALADIGPVMYLAVVGNGAMIPLGGPNWLFTLGLVTTGASFVMYLWANEHKPWPKPGPAPWLAQPTQPVR